MAECCSTDGWVYAIDTRAAVSSSSVADPEKVVDAAESFESMLSGGHPNSLGRTLEVVEMVLNDQARLRDLYDCWFSDDELVRLRVSNGMKRVMREHPDWVAEHIDGFLQDVAKIDQPSTQWTLAQILRGLDSCLTEKQRADAITIVKNNLEHNQDWIVQNTSMQALAEWAESDEQLKNWLIPHLQERLKDPHKSISGRAKKLLAKIEA